jgi:hypothetical protein
MWESIGPVEGSHGDILCRPFSYSGNLRKAEQSCRQIQCAIELQSAPVQSSRQRGYCFGSCLWNFYRFGNLLRRKSGNL